MKYILFSALSPPSADLSGRLHVFLSALQIGLQRQIPLQNHLTYQHHPSIPLTADTMLAIPTRDESFFINARLVVVQIGGRGDAHLNRGLGFAVLIKFLPEDDSAQPGTCPKVVLWLRDTPLPDVTRCRNQIDRECVSSPEGRLHNWR